MSNMISNKISMKLIFQSNLAHTDTLFYSVICHIISVCNKFAHANNIIFNCKKSLSIKYDSEVKENALKLRNNKINWVC